MPASGVAAWVVTWLLVPTIGLLPYVLAVFPSGRIAQPRVRRVAMVAAVALAALAVAQALAPDDLDGVSSAVEPIPNPLGVTALDGVVLVATAVAVLVVVAFTVVAIVDAVGRYRRSGGDERRQLRLVAVPLAVIPVSTAVAIVVPHSNALLYVGQAGGLLGTSVAIGVTILRYRLYDLGAFVRRTAAYAGLSVTVIAAVVLMASLVGVVLSRGGVVPAVAGAAVVALALGPARTRVQRGIDRLLFGRRRDPFGVLTEIGARLATNRDPKSALADIADAVAVSLRLPYVAFEVDAAGMEGVAVAVGAAAGRETRIPLVHEHQAMGHLVVGHRSPDEDLTDAERTLLGDLGRQAAALVQSMTVALGLQQARTRLVDSREEERRRLRRELHDGVGPTLAAATLELDALRDLVVQDPAAAGELVDKLKDQVPLLIDDVRRVAHDLRPPAIDELGVVAAVREYIAAIAATPGAPTVDFTAPAQLPPLPAAVEVAVHRITSEALTNVVRHARATTCRVDLAVDRGVDLRIVDDGIGLPDVPSVGVGLVSMRERATELGGTLTVHRTEPSGTTVRASIPVTA
ncbi:MAG: sensor histidine kinase, partial [Nocardioidaceae bacterium]